MTDLGLEARVDSITCSRCGRDLRLLGSVRYFEGYAAYLCGDRHEVTVVADAFTVESSAKCAACGADLDFDGVDLSSGGLAGRDPVTPL